MHYINLKKEKQAEMSELTAADVVIVPAFGTDVTTLAEIKARGCQIV